MASCAVVSGKVLGLLGEGMLVGFQCDRKQKMLRLTKKISQLDHGLTVQLFPCTLAWTYNFQPH